MAVLLNVLFTRVGIQCYDEVYVCACVCVESESLGVYSSSLLVLLFAANVATAVKLSQKSLLKNTVPRNVVVRAASFSLRGGHVQH